MSPVVLHAWRHPRLLGAPGLCLGRSELPVDPRHLELQVVQICCFARRHRLPRIVLGSPLERCQAVGRLLVRQGWSHRTDDGLLELDFGRWDGRPWSTLPRDEIDAWCDDFMDHAPGGGETVRALLQRVRRFDPGDARVLVTHGGWLSAALWLRDHGSQRPDSARGPAAPRHGVRTALPWPPGGRQADMVQPNTQATGLLPSRSRK